MFGSSQQSPDQGEPREAAEIGADTARSLLRFVAWLLHGDIDEREGLPVRVFYKFDSGGWRSRSTRQLHKVYRCR